MKRTTEIHNGMKVIDSRDVIARIAELEDERQLAAEHNTSETLWTAEDGTTFPDNGDWDEAKEDEFNQLKSLADEASGSPDWKHGETLISEDYFTEYAQELAEDIGAIKSDMGWPCNCIDWDEAADQLKQDYMAVEFGSVTYYIRA